jgi:ATP-dependent DNA helicase RecG
VPEPRDNPQPVTEAVARLRRRLSLALAGGVDPARDPEAAADLLAIEAAAPGDDPDRLAAFLRAMREPASVPDVGRRVVLARGQRFLLELAIALEDRRQAEAPARPRKRPEREAPPPSPPPATPFDPALLDLDGVGPRTASRLASRGLPSPLDLLFWLPRRYDDRRRLVPIAELVPGQRAVARGTVASVRVYGRPWKRIMEVVVEDGGHRLSGLWFSSRRPPPDSFTVGEPVILAGLVGEYRGRRQMPHPVVVHEDTGPGDRVGRIVPVYAPVPGVAGRVVEQAVRCAAGRAGELAPDPLPPEIRSRRGLLPLAEALGLAHVPPDDIDDAELDAWTDGRSPAHRRLAYDEFLYLQLALAIRRRESAGHAAPALAGDAGGDLPSRVGRLLGLEPTAAQRRAIGEIAADLGRETPMRRLLQGDVGSGKTLVALAAVLAAVDGGCQAALMAPTEILAEQHMRTLEPALGRLGLRAALHLGQARSSSRKKALAGFADGRIRLAIGTHALIQGAVRFSRLGLVVVDEQHRFGVSQRLGLVGKGPEGRSPHLLVLTATPIPRTLALTVHGDLDVSVLDELPPGRRPVETRCWSPGEAEAAYADIARALGDGEQAYVVCPLIEESEKLCARAAEERHAALAGRFGADRVGLLHGRLEPERRDAVMDAFLAGGIGVLVTTTVIEVGVDVPGATVMVVEGAERFGLAQLHQLRGRVGRGRRASRCHLIADPASGDAARRLAVLAATGDGFAVAEADLAIRGPGELFGRVQAGLPGFRFGDLARDAELLAAAREDVARLVAGDPGMERPPLRALREELARRIAGGDGPVGEEAG